MKGIILAAGKGTRMYPMTLPVSKPLLPVYDKPMIYYPLATLIEAGIQEILIITPLGNTEAFSSLLGDGSQLGMKISYKEQPVQRGIADALIVGEEFIGEDNVTLILGDNIFYGDSLKDSMKKGQKNKEGAVVYGYHVEDPRAFGVLGFDHEGRVSSIEEKPLQPKSNYIVPGLYFYDNKVIEYAKAIEPSERGELEITSVNNIYLEKKDLHVVLLEKDILWLDAGSAQSLLDSASYISKIQKLRGLVACIEISAYKNGWIDRNQLKSLGKRLEKTNYGQFILEYLQKN